MSQASRTMGRGTRRQAERERYRINRINRIARIVRIAHISRIACITIVFHVAGFTRIARSKLLPHPGRTHHPHTSGLTLRGNW